jgi:EAL domain-containing protein (putative c-di-GMP-specific phosphodiesterase class I)
MEILLAVSSALNLALLAALFHLYYREKTGCALSKPPQTAAAPTPVVPQLSENALCKCPLFGEVKLSQLSPETLQSCVERELAAQHFEVWLQPKIPINGRGGLEAEALIRYRHPEDGILSPGKFVPPLENLRLIYLIDLFVFEETARLLSAWKGRYELPVISLNFSRHTLARNHLMGQMRAIAGRYDFPLRNLEIEVTESVGNVARTAFLQACAAIRAEGFGLSLDDFGAEHSNVAILAAVKFDAIKLDKSIIDRLLSCERNQIITQEFLRTCRKLGAQSIAEGVETKEQLDALKKLGCDYVQGYFFDKPMTQAAFEEKYLKPPAA